MCYYIDYGLVILTCLATFINFVSFYKLGGCNCHVHRIFIFKDKFYFIQVCMPIASILFWLRIPQSKPSHQWPVKLTIQEISCKTKKGLVYSWVLIFYTSVKNSFIWPSLSHLGAPKRGHLLLKVPIIWRFRWFHQCSFDMVPFVKLGVVQVQPPKFKRISTERERELCCACGLFYIKMYTYIYLFWCYKSLYILWGGNFGGVQLHARFPNERRLKGKKGRISFWQGALVCLSSSLGAGKDIHIGSFFSSSGSSFPCQQSHYCLSSLSICSPSPFAFPSHSSETPPQTPFQKRPKPIHDKPKATYNNNKQTMTNPQTKKKKKKK